MAAYDSGLVSASTTGPTNVASIPVPAVAAFGSVTSDFTGAPTLEIIWTGPASNHITSPVGTYRVFTGTDQYGKNGTFACTIDLSSQSSGVVIGSGTEGTGLFTGGKGGTRAISITLPLAATNTGRSAGAANTVYVTFVPMDAAGHSTFILQLTGTIT